MLATLYAITVQRGEWGCAKRPWEVAVSGSIPFRTRIFAEQRIPEYPRAVRWLEPALVVVHFVDLRVRRAYWYEEYVPQFDDAPDFVLSQ